MRIDTTTFACLNIGEHAMTQRHRWLGAPKNPRDSQKSCIGPRSLVAQRVAQSPRISVRHQDGVKRSSKPHNPHLNPSGWVSRTTKAQIEILTFQRRSFISVDGGSKISFSDCPNLFIFASVSYCDAKCEWRRHYHPGQVQLLPLIRHTSFRIG